MYNIVIITYVLNGKIPGILENIHQQPLTAVQQALHAFYQFASHFVSVGFDTFG